MIHEQLNQVPQFQADAIKEIVAAHYQVPLEYILEKGRNVERVRARQALTYLLRKHTQLSLKSIGLAVGGQDHTTVLNALQKVQDLLETDSEYRSTVMFLSREISIKSKAAMSYNVLVDGVGYKVSMIEIMAIEQSNTEQMNHLIELIKQQYNPVFKAEWSISTTAPQEPFKTVILGYNH